RAPTFGYFGSQFVVDLGENGGSLLDVLLQKLFSFCQGHFFLSPVGYISCQLDKSAQRPARISEGRDDDVSPEPGAVFSDSPSFILAVSVAAGVRQHLLRLTPHHGVSGIKDGKMFADNVLGKVALQALRSGIPADHAPVRIQLKKGVLLNVLDG